MEASTRFKLVWSVLMTIGGLAIAAGVYAVTDSLVWAAAGLLAAGVVLNVVGQAITRPARR